MVRNEDVTSLYLLVFSSLVVVFKFTVVVICSSVCVDISIFVVLSGVAITVVVSSNPVVTL